MHFLTLCSKYEYWKKMTCDQGWTGCVSILKEHRTAADSRVDLIVVSLSTRRKKDEEEVRVYVNVIRAPGLISVEEPHDACGPWLKYD